MPSENSEALICESALPCAELEDAGPSLTAGWLWCVSGIAILLAVIAAALIVRNACLTRRARAQRLGSPVLRPGLAVLEGTIDEPSEPPLRVEIRQSGIKNFGEDGGRIEWSELSREVTAKPFRLRLESGEVVEVEPRDAAKLLLPITRTETDAPTKRRRIAEAKDGDRIHISGRLEGHKIMDATNGYRGAMTTKYKLLPSRSGPMLVSREPLESVVRSPLPRYVGALVLATVMLVSAHAIFVGYHLRSAAGRVTAGMVTDKRTWVDEEGHTQYEFRLTVPVQDGPIVAGPTAACYQTAERGACVDVLFAPWAPSFWQLGSKPSATIAHVVLSSYLLVGLAVWYAILLIGGRKWYSGKLLDEAGE